MARPSRSPTGGAVGVPPGSTNHPSSTRPFSVVDAVAPRRHGRVRVGERRQARARRAKAHRVGCRRHRPVRRRTVGRAMDRRTRRAPSRAPGARRRAKQPCSAGGSPGRRSVPSPRFDDVVGLPGAAAAERHGVPPSLDHPTLLVGPEGGWSDSGAGAPADHALAWVTWYFGPRPPPLRAPHSSRPFARVWWHPSGVFRRQSPGERGHGRWSLCRPDDPQ